MGTVQKAPHHAKQVPRGGLSVKIKKLRLYRKSMASVVLTALALTFVAPGAAQAASGNLSSVSLDQVTGTAPFDADNNPGNDSSASNDVVRTNDNVTYRTEITVGTKKAPGSHLYVYLPKGEQVTQLPPYCLDGSTISPSLKDPGGSLTATSWTELKAQTVDCFLGDLPAASSQIYSITSRVRPEVPDNTRLANVTAKVTSGTGTLTTNPVSHRVSAKANYDVAIGWSTKKNGGYIWGPSGNKCPDDLVSGCYQTQSIVFMISAPDGGRGNSPLRSGFSFQMDLSAKGVFGDKITTTDAWKAAGDKAEETFRPTIPASLRNCLIDTSHHYGPLSNMAAAEATPDNSVRDSGTVVCTHDPATGIMTVTVTGADTSAWTYPTTRGNGTAALPEGNAYVFSKSMSLNVPISTVKALGIPSSTEPGQPASVWTLPQNLRVSELTGQSLGGSSDIATGAHTVDWNNYRTSSLVAKDEGTFESFWSGVPGTRGNTPKEQFRPGWQSWEGLPGQGGIYGGDGILLEDQVGLVAVVGVVQGNKPGVGQLSCTSWDNAFMSLTSKDNYLSAGPINQVIPSGGKPVWISGTYYKGTPNAPLLEVEYGSGPAGSAENSGCNNEDSKYGWSTDPALVKDFKTGKVATAADIADGNFKAVNRVRALVTQPGTDRNITSTAVSLRYTGGKESGETLAFWTRVKSVDYYANITEAAADTSNPFAKANYNPGATSEDPQSGNGGGRALVGVATSRVKTQFADSAGNYGAGTPAFVAGSEVKLRLTPSIVTPIDTSKSYPMSLELCLPPNTSYLAGSSTLKPGGDTQVPAGTTLGESIACQPGERYVTFDMGRKVPNTAITPVEMLVKIATSAPNTVIKARTAITVAGDGSPAANRQSSASLQVESPIGIRIGRTAANSILEVNPEASMAAPRTMSWNTQFMNLNSPTSVSDVEVYEVLPRNGYGTTKFNGTLAFGSAVVEKGDAAIKIQYTNSKTLAVDETTGEPSAATWYDTVAAAGGSNAITGLKITRPGPFTPGDDLNIRVTMIPLNNQPGNVYEGRVSGKAAGLKSAVGPEISAVEIVSSSIGDRMWIDNNKDGLQNAGEIGLAGKPVTLTGTDTEGNRVGPKTVTTSSTGAYSFGRLASGEYTVDFGKDALLLDDYVFAAPDLGKGADDSSPSRDTGITNVSLRAGAVLDDVDAGVQTNNTLTTSVTADPVSGSYISEKDPVGYTLTLTNDGSKPFSGTVVDVTVDAGIKLKAPVASQAGGKVSLSGNKVTFTGALARGETKQVKFEGVTGALTKDTVVNARVSGSGTWVGGKQASTCDINATDACVVALSWSAPKLAVTAAIAQSAPADPLATLDEKLTYSFTVTNPGNVPVQAVRTQIQMPVGNTLAADTNGTETTYDSPRGAADVLAPKGSVGFGAVTHTYTVDQNDVDWGKILATVTALGTTKAGLGTESTGFDSIVATPTTSQLRMTAAVTDDSGDGTAQVGEELIYRFKVINTGTVSIQNLDIKDAFLNGAGVPIAPEHTYDGLLSPGEAVVYVSRSYVVTPEDKTAKSVTTNSTARGTTRLAVPVESNAHQLVASTPSADGLDIVKRVTDAGGDGFADLGEQLTYTFTVTNNSSVAAPDGTAVGSEFHALAITDPMLAGIEIKPSAADAAFDGRLVPGQSVTYVSGGYAVTAANAAAGKVTNTATAKAVDSFNKVVASNTATASIPATPTKVIIKTGSGAAPQQAVLQGTAGALLLLGALAAAMVGYRRRYGQQ